MGREEKGKFPLQFSNRVGHIQRARKACHAPFFAAGFFAAAFFTGAFCVGKRGGALEG
jgi:hypothetical protein